MLVPGRGLRGVKAIDMQSRYTGTPWAVAAQIETPYGVQKIGTGLDVGGEKRVVRLNGKTPAGGQSALAEHLACVWLTPQMDRLFLDSASERRRFLDRLIVAFDPGHAGRTTRYENAMAQRSKLLREGPADQSWLSALEAQMAETGIAIAAARLDFVARLGQAKMQDPLFPNSTLRVRGTVEELLGSAPALEVEDMLAYQLGQSREKDALTGGAASGHHKSDLMVLYTQKDMPASQCSTGEQKALLIGIILAHARLIAAERGVPPVLLLDEVAAHLDEERREGLYRVLESLGAQVWMTGTEPSLFLSLQGRAQSFSIHGGQVALAQAA